MMMLGHHGPSTKLAPTHTGIHTCVTSLYVIFTLYVTRLENEQEEKRDLGMIGLGIAARQSHRRMLGLQELHCVVHYMAT